MESPRQWKPVIWKSNRHRTSPASSECYRKLGSHNALADRGGPKLQLRGLRAQTRPGTNITSQHSDKKARSSMSCKASRPQGCSTRQALKSQTSAAWGRDRQLPHTSKAKPQSHGTKSSHCGWHSDQHGGLEQREALLRNLTRVKRQRRPKVKQPGVRSQPALVSSSFFQQSFEHV